jgi:hypothetical protein
MPAVEAGDIEQYRRQIENGALKGRILDPLPQAQTQEGPNCGFYALSIVMAYWKARGKVDASPVARKRDAPDDGTGERSLRNIGKEVGALDVDDLPEHSTGGVFTATQLAAVAAAVRQFEAKILTKQAPNDFIDALCTLIDKGLPPIVAFDVQQGDPAQLGGQHSHWGVVIGHYTQSGTRRFLATHGHGKYYVWLATDLQQSNFGLAGTRRALHKEVKVRLKLKPGVDDPKVQPLARWHWADAKELSKVKALLADKGSKVQGIEFKSPAVVREGLEVAQDLAYHIVAVLPAA